VRLLVKTSRSYLRFVVLLLLVIVAAFSFSLLRAVLIVTGAFSNEIMLERGAIRVVVRHYIPNVSLQRRNGIHVISYAEYPPDIRWRIVWDRSEVLDHYIVPLWVPMSINLAALIVCCRINCRRVRQAKLGLDSAKEIGVKSCCSANEMTR